MPKRSPFVVSQTERTGVILTLFALCIFKLIEPLIHRFNRSQYDRPIEWSVTDTVYRYRSADQKVSFNKNITKPKSAYTQKVVSYPKFDLGDINTADTTQLKRVHGIGPVLAKRIVKYRAYLGHFVAMEQLEDVYHLPDSVYVKLQKRFTLDTLNLNRISINSASEKDLLSLPYLSKEEVRWVLAVRKARGAFSSKEELTNVFIKTLNKKPFILLYLTL
jgi:DNA uptake protein ComE-like DNA-binding protein